MQKRKTKLVFESFKYSNIEDSPITEFYNNVLDNIDDKSSQLSIETAPPGFGKTHILIHKLIEACKDRLFDTSIHAPLVILIVAPMHRHVAEVYRALNQYRESLNESNKNLFLLKRARSIVDMLRDYENYLSNGCPIFESTIPRKDKYYQLRIESRMIVKEAARVATTAAGASDQVRLMRSKLRREYCSKFIESGGYDKICNSCNLMHVGKEVFQEEKSHKVIYLFSTYHKLYFGYESFELSQDKQYRSVRYSPWVTFPQGRERPIKNTLLFMEEFSGGFQYLWNLIDGENLRINVAEYTAYIYKNLKRAIYEIFAQMMTDCMGSSQSTQTEIQTIIGDLQEKLSDTIDNFEKLYIKVDGSKRHTLKDDTSLVFKGDYKEAKDVVYAADMFFNRLFTSRVIGYRATYHNQFNSITANVRGFKKGKECLDDKRELIHPLASNWKELGILPHVRYFRKLRLAVIELTGDYFSLAVNKLYADDNETSRNKREYFYSLFNQLEKAFRLKQTQKLDSQSQFYIHGYEVYSMPAQEEKEERIIQLDARVRTPEGMIFSVLQPNLKNEICAISASAAIDCPIVTFNLPWLEKVGINVKVRSPESLNFLMAKKYDPLHRGLPDVKIAEEITTWIKSNSEVAEYSKNIIIKFFKQCVDVEQLKAESAEEPLNALLCFLQKLCEQRDDPHPHYVLYLTNAIEDTQIADRIVTKYFKWAKEIHLDLGIELGDTLVVTAEEFQIDSADVQKSEVQFRRIDQFQNNFKTHLLSNETPKVFFLAGAYNSVATGANFQQRIPLKELQAEIENGKAQNFLRYVGTENHIRYYESRNPTVDIDLSDLILSVAKTYITNSNNYLSIAHILMATNTIEFPVIGRRLIQSLGQDAWIPVSSVIKQTQDYALALFESVHQVVGRMDRSLILPVKAQIIISDDLAKHLKRFDGTRIEKTIITRTLERVLMKIRETTNNQPVVSYTGLNSIEIIENLYRDAVGGSTDAQVLWFELRKFLQAHQSLSPTTLFEGLSKNPQSNTATSIINLCKTYTKYASKKYSTKKLCKPFIESFYDYVPASYVEINKSRYNKRALIKVNGVTDTAKMTRSYGPTTYYSASARTMKYATVDQAVHSLESQVLLLQPAIMQRVAIPAYDEQETGTFLYRRGLQVERLSADLFELADWYAPKLRLLIDNKSFSQFYMETEFTDDMRIEQLAIARSRLQKAQAYLGGEQQRLIYVFRNWWPTLNDKPIQCYSLENDCLLSETNWPTFNIAFVHHDSLEDLGFLWDLIRLISTS